MKRTLPAPTRLAVALAALTLGGTAVAQTTGESTELQARHHFEQGMALVQQSRWADAVRELEASASLHPVPAAYFNLGVAHRALGHPRAAIRAYRAYLDAVGNAGGSRRTEVEAAITELTASLATLTLDVTPADAHVTVDGEEVPANTRSLQLDPGSHVVVASAPRFESQEQRVELEPGHTAPATLRLNPVAAQGANTAGSGPSAGASGGAGSGGGGIGVGPVALLGLGVVGMGAFGVFGYLQSQAYAGFYRDNGCVGDGGAWHCPASAQNDSRLGQGSTYTVIADAALIVGGVALAGGVVWAVVNLTSGGSSQAERPPGRARLRLTPFGVVAPGAAVAGVGGRF